MLSGYRLMWLVVMFDLPVIEREERKAATAFRNDLLDMGFEMSQFSVYVRFCSSPNQIETYCKRIENCLPKGGKVSILQFTVNDTLKLSHLPRSMFKKRGVKVSHC